MAKQFLADYLNFTRKERIGIITVLVLLVFFLLLPFFIPFFITEPAYDHSSFEKEIAALHIKQQDSTANYTNQNFDENNDQHYYQPSTRNDYAKQPAGELFYFDPNTLPAAGWIKLGIREKTAVTIQKYVSKGGRFYKPEDISKIWGLHADDVNRLMPYVRIEAGAASDLSTSKTPETYKNYDKPKYSIGPVDINAGDTAAFIALPGIGSKLANRIVTFREKLGGFYSIDQVGETYGLPDSTFQKIKEKLILGNSDVKKININLATADELKAHPYIRYTIANAIMQYRTLHGAFATVDDLKKIMIITDEIFNKAAPYLTAR